MSGLVAQLEDARELAEQLRDSLDDIEYRANELGAYDEAHRLLGMRDVADDLASRIDNLRTALRGS